MDISTKGQGLYVQLYKITLLSSLFLKDPNMESSWLAKQSKNETDMFIYRQHLFKIIYLSFSVMLHILILQCKQHLS